MQYGNQVCTNTEYTTACHLCVCFCVEEGSNSFVLELQVSILLATELIWNLCEVLFIDAAPGESLTLFMLLHFLLIFFKLLCFYYVLSCTWDKESKQKMCLCVQSGVPATSPTGLGKITQGWCGWEGQRGAAKWEPGWAPRLLGCGKCSACTHTCTHNINVLFYITTIKLALLEFGKKL